MSDTNTKKPRALPRVWKSFSKLVKGEKCYLGNTLVGKTSFLTAREYGGPGCYGVPVAKGALHFVAPWTKVKTTVLVRDAKSGGLSSVGPRLSRASILHRPQPPLTVEVPNGNQQPNSDNAVTGPTS